jgi:hypothetical protein
MSEHHWRAIAITVIGPKLPNQTTESDIFIWAKGHFRIWRLQQTTHHDRSWKARRRSLFGTDVGALLSHRTLHQQHREQRRQRHHGQQEEDIEIGK